MPTLQEILRDPNYVNANPATKQAIFERWAPQDTNFTSANPATQAAIRQRFGVGVAAEPELQPKEESGFLRQAADVPLSAGRGVLTGVRMIADAFGAGSKASEAIKGAEGYLASLMSAQAKNDEQEIARIMKDAEDKGVLDQVKAGLKAFSVAPVDLLTQGLGTAAPALVGMLGGNVLGAGALGARVIGAGIGAGMGAGATKGGIYEETKKVLMEAGLDEKRAEEKAQQAQAYGGKNLDQILLGTGLGAFASATGLEGSISRILGGAAGKTGIKQAAKTAATQAVAEAAPEFVQASQEQLAKNIALQREGVDVPTMRGVVGAGTLEGLAGAGLGAGFGAAEVGLRGKARTDAQRILEEERRSQAEKERAPAEPTPPVEPAPTAEREMSLEELERATGMASAPEPSTVEELIAEEPAAPEVAPEAAPAEPVAVAEPVEKPTVEPAAAEAQPEAPVRQELRDLVFNQEPATEYDTPENRLRESDAFGQDLSSLIKDELESYGRAAIKNRKLTEKAMDMRETWAAASDAATIAFATGDYEQFRPYERFFSKTAAKLKSEIGKITKLAKEDERALAEIDRPFSIAEEMEGVPAPLPTEIEEEVGKLTEDQAAAIAEREKLEKRTAGTSLVQVLRGTLNDNELSELGGRARKVGKNQFLNLKAPKGQTGSSMEDMVNSGKLDIFLPENMRPDHPDYENSESAEYIREKLRNNQFYTYDTQLEIERVNQDIESIERRIQELLSDDDINKEIQYAVDEQRELDQAAEEPAAEGAPGAPEQREAKATDDELDRREAQLDREKELNDREAKLLEERKRLEEERLRLEQPTKQDIAEQEERKAKAAELDEREQIRKESEAGAGQFELTQEEGRQDTTGSLFEQPAQEPETLEIGTEEERKNALQGFWKSLSTDVPNFKARAGDGRVTVIKPGRLNGIVSGEVYDLSIAALDLGLPPAVLGNVKAAGSTRSDAVAMMTTTGWLLIGKQWNTSSRAEKLTAVIHELAHSVDTEGGNVSDSKKWEQAHRELNNWYAKSLNKISHPFAYPFAPQYRGKVRMEMESFAQAFAHYFVSPVDLQTNAPEAYSQIQSIVERIQNESQQARTTGTAKTGTAGIKVQPTRAAKGPEVQPETREVGAAVSPTQRVQDRAARQVAEVEFFEDIPNEKWLQGKIEYAQRSPRNAFGVPKMSSVTGRFKSPVIIPARWFKGVKGQRGEEKNVRQKDLEAIRKIIRDTGKFPLNDDGTEYVPYIEIGYDGKPWISEGNHRVMAAIAEGMEYIPVELRYFDGGQRRAGVWGPGNVASITERIASETADINMMQAPEKGRENIFGEKVMGTWTEPTETKMAGELGKDDIIYWLQDKMVDTKRVVEAITKTTGKIAERWNPYLQEELYHGRTAKETNDFLGKELRPLMQEMQKNNVTIGEFEQYLHNRHAEAYNNQVAKVNPDDPDMQDGGSGITTEDARNYLDSLPDDKRKIYESLAEKLDGITKGTRELLVKSGLESRDTIKAWEAAFPDYVPLHREDVDFQYTTNSTGTGQGFDVRGAFSRRAMGSKRKVVDILANVAMQRERAIVKANKNRVAEAVYGLALQNPNPEFWLAVNPMAEKVPEAALEELRAMGIDEEAVKFLMKEPRQRAVDPKKNEVVSRINTVLRNNDNVLSMRLNGENRYVFFNPNNERSARAAKALKNLDADQLSYVMGSIAKITRWMASVNTQYNPIFGAYNFLRDVQGAALQLTNTPLAGKQKQVTANVVPALRAIYTSIRKARKGEEVDTEMAKLWDDFQKAGGQTGFRDMFSRSQERAEALQKEFMQMSEGKIKSAGRAVRDWLSDYNDTMENAVRLAAYKVALDSGMNKEEAASVAKNLTVNFNRKGQVGVQAGALYAFFNAAVQGTTRLAQTLKGPAGRKIMAGGLLLGTIQAVMLAAAGFDDEEPPEFVRERNVIIPIGGDKYLAFPMPLGYHVIPGTSRILTEWILSGFKDTPERVASLTGMFLEAFNPIGNAGWSVQSIAPTFADPLVALAENKDWTGKPIARKDFSNLDPTPGYTRAKDSASWVSTKIAEFLNYVSGGTKYQPGILSPTPDQIDYLIGQATGGLGREALKVEQTITKTATGEELPPYKIPLVGRFYGETKSSAAESARFYKNLERLNKLENELKGRRENKESTADFLRENPEVRLAARARDIQTDIKKLRDRREKLVERKASRESVKVVEEQITAKMRLLNEQVSRFED